MLHFVKQGWDWSKFDCFGTSSAGYSKGIWLKSVPHQPLGLVTPFLSKFLAKFAAIAFCNKGSK
eukprot:1137491-Pelagomonas_calceolata.AAC.3